MAAGSFLQARGAYASARDAVVKKNLSHTFTSGKPVGMYEDGSHSSLMPSIIVGSNQLREAQPSTNLGHWSFALHPEEMGTVLYTATVRVGDLSNGTDRGVIVAVGGSNGAGGPGVTNCLCMMVRGQGGLKALMRTKIGLGLDMNNGAFDRAQSSANVLVAPNDTIGIQITRAAGVYTYTGLKNGSPIAGCAWTDSGNVFGTPGKNWGGGFYCIRSGGFYYSSLGIFAMSCVDN